MGRILEYSGSIWGTCLEPETGAFITCALFECRVILTYGRDPGYVIVSILEHSQVFIVVLLQIHFIAA